MTVALAISHPSGGRAMKTSSVLVRAGVVSLMVLAAGCSSTNWPRMSGSGNSTSYATGSYPMPPKAAATTANANARANGDATAADTRTRTEGPTDTNTVMAAQQALSKFGYNPGSTDGTY